MEDFKIRKAASSCQLNGLVEFMQEHPELAKGTHRGSNGRRISNKLWKLCAEKLNALEGSPRDFRGWARYWCDWKCRVRRKALELKQAKNCNSSLDSTLLTELDEIVLSLSGKQAVEGVVVKSDPLADQDSEDEDNQVDNNDEESRSHPFASTTSSTRAATLRGRKRRYSSREPSEVDTSDIKPPLSKDKSDSDDDGDNNLLADNEAAAFLRIEKQKLASTKRLTKAIQDVAKQVNRVADALTVIKDVLVNRSQI